MIADDRLDTLDPEQLRQAMRALMAEMARKDELIEQHRREAVFKQATVVSHVDLHFTARLFPQCFTGQHVDTVRQ